MSTQLGKTSFLDTPDVNGSLVLTALTGAAASSTTVLQVLTGLIPAFSTTAQNTTGYTAVPIITDGGQIWSQSITPISATSRILVIQSILISHSKGAVIFLTSFAGNTNIGLNAVNNTGGLPDDLSVTLVYTPGSKAPITISARVASTTAGTTYINQTSAGNFGTPAGVTQYIIMEVA